MKQLKNTESAQLWIEMCVCVCVCVCVWLRGFNFLISKPAPKPPPRESFACKEKM